MTKITVLVDKETYRLACIAAAERGTSVSALVRDYLVGLAQSQMTESEFDRLHRLQDLTLAAITHGAAVCGLQTTSRVGAAPARLVPLTLAAWSS